MCSIEVGVRVRPFNSREMKFDSKLIVAMEKQCTLLHVVRNGKICNEEQPRKFNFDYCFWTHVPGADDYADQRYVYDVIGKRILDNATQGYNSCLFAYGQTGSGKTYTMMGTPSDAGIIPRLCVDLFKRARDTELTHRYSVECSYLEIYNENVKDLLNPSNLNASLKVRQHPKLGVYVEGLSKLQVATDDEVMHLLDEGGKVRAIAATNMNATSSRSHAILTLFIRIRSKDGELASQLHLVDLAGSERAASTGATGETLLEGANINKSLSVLGMCLARLAEVTDGKHGGHIPFRDSQLTWLLNNSLGGNSKTAMLAAISPADINYEETLSTLRFAATTKKIKNNATVNEDPQQRLIRELREEIELIKQKIKRFEEGSAKNAAILAAARAANPNTLSPREANIAPESPADRQPPPLELEPEKVEGVDPAAPTEKPLEPADTTEKPLEPAAATEKPLEPAAPTEKPLEPAAPTEKPLEPAAATEKPLEPADTTEKPLEPADTTEKPLEPAAATEKPLEPAAATEKPLEPADTTEKPLEPADTTEKPLEPAAATEKPLEPEPAAATEKPLEPAAAEKPLEPEKPHSRSHASLPTEKPLEPAAATEKPLEPAAATEKPLEPADPTEKPLEPAAATEKPLEPAAPAEKPLEPAA